MFVKCGPNIQVCNSHHDRCYPDSKNVPGTRNADVYYVIAPKSVRLDMYLDMHAGAHLHIPWSPMQPGYNLSFQLAVLDEDARIVEEVLACIDTKSDDRFFARVIEILVQN